jgi:dihydroflavonol-4-reductase
MQQVYLSLVTGANGHLGNNLVRHLIQQGVLVRASVRSLKNKAPFAGLNCEVVQADITDKASLLRAMDGVETVYAVGAAFKLWAKDKQKEIYDVNMAGTRNTIEAAAQAGVKKIVYVSSIAALHHASLPIREANGFNPDRRNVYYNSKNDSEQLALQLAQELGLEIVTVLPSAMIGGENFGLNESYNLLATIYQKKVPVETSIYLNWVDVKDVAAACYQAALHGKNGQRYTLASAHGMSIRETTELVQRLYPSLGLKLPVKAPKWLL